MGKSIIDPFSLSEIRRKNMEENRINIDLDRPIDKINIKADVLERNGFVKVVNCKDCIKGINKGNMVICCEDSRMMRIKGLDDFCSCGVKKEEG